MKKKSCLIIAVIMLFNCIGCGSVEQQGEKEQESIVTEIQIEQPTVNEAYVLDESIIPKETVTLDVYTQLSDYVGEQQGWFAKVMLDKFNVKLNFTNNGSEELLTQLSEKGDLGDIVIFATDTDQYKSAVSQGLLLDWEKNGILNEYGSYIAENMPKAIEKNRKNSGGHVYAIGHDIAYESGEFGDFDYHPDIRWDLYEAIGMPEVTELEDYVNVLKQMKEICPTSDTGEETYGVSLFNDWDGDMVMFVKSTCTNFFGMDEFGVGLYNVDNGTFEGCLQENGKYIRALKFYNELYRNDLLDPESRTQGYDGCVADYSSGSAFFCIFGWLAAPQYNTIYHIADGKMMLPLAARNQDTMVYGLNENGSERLWTIGAKTKYPELVMSIINWLCTPEGRLTVEYGPKGIFWDYDTNKNTCLIENGFALYQAAGYTGDWGEGIPRFNNTTWVVNTRNPESNGQTYNSNYWPNVTAASVSGIEKRWQEATGNTTAKEYLSQFTHSISKPNTYTAGTKSEELATKWGAVTECIRNGSWNAIYAESEAEFEKIVDEMQMSATEAGYEECVAWCEAEAAKRKALED